MDQGGGPFTPACKMSVSNNEFIADRIIKFKELTGTPETAYHWYQWEEQIFDSRYPNYTAW